MGVQPRAYSVEDNMSKSPSMNSATSPISRKRRFMDVVLVNDHSQDEEQEEAQLQERVSFKRSKTDDDEDDLRVQIHDASPTADDLSVTTPKSEPSPTSSKSARPNMSASQTITLEMLRPHFEKPLAQVAQIFSICVTLLKKICRKNGLARWPHRQIIGLRKSISSMEQAIGHFEGARRDSYAQQLEKQRNKLAALLEDPTKCSLLSVDEDNYNHAPTPQHHRAPVAYAPEPHYHHHQYPPVYERGYPPHPTYESSYYRDHHHHYEARSAPPRSHYDAPYAPPPHYDSYHHHHQQQHHYREEAYEYHTPSYSHSHAPSVPLPPAPPSLSLPPLRIDSRQSLPSLSSVVGRRW